MSLIQNQRKTFESNIQAVISVMANVVGLGNIWRFPYQSFKNGGGAFFIHYILMPIIAATPIMGMEMAWVQFTSLGPVDSWNSERYQTIENLKKIVSATKHLYKAVSTIN